MSEARNPRRDFLRLVSAAGMGLILPWQVARGHAQETQEEPTADLEPISPTEELMREHGVLRRIFLVFEEALRRIAAKRQDVRPEVVREGASVIRRYIQDYHERLEENYLFPPVEKAGRHVELVQTLRQQHQAGRQVVDVILDAATPDLLKNSRDQDSVANAIRLFIHMYRPHAAREDTVLFPAFRAIVPAREFAALATDFAGKDHQMSGEKGFSAIVNRVAILEREMGIYDLTGSAGLRLSKS